MATGPLPPDAGAGPPPKFTRLSGEQLWSAVLNRYELEQHELVILREIVRCVDDLDRLANLAGKQGAVTASGIHPAITEARQMRITLATLIGALRLPEVDDREQVELRRPRRRPAVRSVDPPTSPTQDRLAIVRSNETPTPPQAPAAVVRRMNPPAPPQGRRNIADGQPVHRQISVAELMAKVRNGDYPAPAAAATPRYQTPLQR